MAGQTILPPSHHTGVPLPSILLKVSGCKAGTERRSLTGLLPSLAVSGAWEFIRLEYAKVSLGMLEWSNN